MVEDGRNALLPVLSSSLETCLKWKHLKSPKVLSDHLQIGIQNVQLTQKKFQIFRFLWKIWNI